jgi:NTP pyrophosphatase (non-canonical NTP hydrolase)
MTQDNLTFAALRTANEIRQAEWDGDAKIDLAYRAAEMAGEAGEACNVAKKIERERRGIRGSRATLADLADELADVVICVDLMAAGEGIDLAAAVARKFNATSEKVGLTTRIDAADDGDLVALLVQRFLAWRLPDDFNPDGGVSFVPVLNPGTDYAHRNRPVGTNLLTAVQAEAMVRHLLGGAS